MSSTDERQEHSTRTSSARKTVTTVLKIILGIFIFIIVTAAGIAIGFVTANINAKPDIAGEILPPASSQIYDSAGNEIANIHAAENRMPVKIEQIPTALQHAFIAIEDNRFYEHNGIDPRGLARAAYANIMSNEIAEGGSTITQQLAKNAYLTQDRTFKRKIQEVFLALQLEKQYTKQEILELYLNQIYFGRGAYGVQAAAITYFNKNVSDLDLSECALLAGIPKSPNY
jgi:penicillin-binding protein 1A